LSPSSHPLCSFKSEAEILAEVNEIWAALAQETIDGLVNSFRSRLELCVKVNGNSISQLLSSCRLEPRAQGIAGLSEVPPFTVEVDDFIRSYVEQHGRKWTQMSRRDEAKGFSPILLKNRWIELWVEERNDEAVGFRATEIMLADIAVVDVFDPTDPEGDDAAAELAVADEEPTGTETGEEDSGSSDDEVVPANASPPGYIAFCNQHRAEVRAKNKGVTWKMIGAILGGMWRELSEADRAAYRSSAGPRAKRRAPVRAQPKGRGWHGGRAGKVIEPGEGE
jgi:hypothetical protein